jgi:hypothetical protein
MGMNILRREEKTVYNISERYSDMDKMAETSTLWLAKILQFVYKEKREEKSDTETDSDME